MTTELLPTTEPLALKSNLVLGPNEEKPKKRLWVVRVVYEAYVLAADEDEAQSRKGAIERWEDFPKVQAYPWLHETLDGWTDDCLVYCAKDEDDITLGAAKALGLGA